MAETTDGTASDLASRSEIAQSWRRTETRVRRRPSHAAKPWGLVLARPRRTARTWLTFVSLGCLAILAALGPLLVSR